MTAGPALSTVADRVYVPEGDRLFVYDDDVLRTTIRASAGEVVLDEASHLVIVRDDQHVTAFDDRTFKTIATGVPAGRPRALAVDSARGLLFVGTSSGLTTVDDRTGKVLRTVTGIGAVDDVAVDSDRATT